MKLSLDLPDKDYKYAAIFYREDDRIHAFGKFLGSNTVHDMNGFIECMMNICAEQAYIAGFEDPRILGEIWLQSSFKALKGAFDSDQSCITGTANLDAEENKENKEGKNETRN